MSIVDGWVLEGCSGAVGRNRPRVDQMDWMARSVVSLLTRPGLFLIRPGKIRQTHARLSETTKISSAAQSSLCWSKVSMAGQQNPLVGRDSMRRIRRKGLAKPT